MEVAKVLEAIWRGRSREPGIILLSACRRGLNVPGYRSIYRRAEIQRYPPGAVFQERWNRVDCTGEWGRGSGRIWTHAPGATRGSRSVITSASLVLSPSYHYSRAYHPLDLLHVHTRRTRVPHARGGKAKRDDAGLNVHAHDRSRRSAY